jgi:hypothetical protein
MSEQLEPRVSPEPSEEVSTNDERRWDRGAWLTLAIAVLLILWPLTLSLASFRFPVDGWMSSPSGTTFSQGGAYTLLDNLSGQPSFLQTGDVVIAIDGQPLRSDALPPLPADLQFGQILTYTVERNGRQVTVDVTLIRQNIAAIGQALLRVPSSTFQMLTLFCLPLFVFLLRPGNHGGRYLLLAFSQWLGGFMNQASYSFYRTSFPPGLNFLTDFYSVGWAWFFFPTLTLFVLVYPKRQWPLRRFPRLVPILLYTTFIVLAALPIARTISTRVPSGQALSAFGIILLISTFFVATVGSLVLNLRRGRNPVERAQTRWLGFGIFIGIVLPVTLITIADFLLIDSPAYQLLQSLSAFTPIILGISLAVGILRYRLFDIDVIIRRTTQYVVVTGILLLVLFGLVVVLQYLFSRVTGQSSTPAVVLSTLAIAALFNPVRRRVQDIIDRRFFRQKYDAEKTIEAFAATVRNETELDALTAELLRVIQDTMQPATLSIWLRDPAVEKAQLQHSTRLENEG